MCAVLEGTQLFTLLCMVCGVCTLVAPTLTMGLLGVSFLITFLSMCYKINRGKALEGSMNQGDRATDIEDAADE